MSSGRVPLPLQFRGICARTVVDHRKYICVHIVLCMEAVKDELHWWPLVDVRKQPQTQELELHSVCFSQAPTAAATFLTCLNTCYWKFASTAVRIILAVPGGSWGSQPPKRPDCTQSRPPPPSPHEQLGQIQLLHLLVCVCIENRGLITVFSAVYCCAIVSATE